MSFKAVLRLVCRDDFTSFADVKGPVATDTSAPGWIEESMCVCIRRVYLPDLATELDHHRGAGGVHSELRRAGSPQEIRLTKAGPFSQKPEH